jgi:Flp pilus assembly protein TadG
MEDCTKAASIARVYSRNPSKVFGAAASRVLSRSRPGGTFVYLIFALILLIGFGTLCVDAGRVQLAKTELGEVAEASARYAVTGLADGTATSKAIAQAAQDNVDGTPFTLPSADVEIGTWDSAAKSFTVTATDPNAVRVTARRTASEGTAIKLTFGAVIGKSTCDVRASTIAFYNLNVMLVVGSTTLAATDILTRNRLIGLGYNVVVRDSTFSTAEAAVMRLIVVSETCVSSTVNNKLLNVAVPVVNYEPYLVDDMQMTGAVVDTDYGLTTVGNRISIDMPGHPLAAGFTGTVVITTLPATTSNGGLAWGVPAGGGVKVASIPGEPTHAGVYCWDTGVLMDGGLSAPARRVGFFGSGPLGSFTGGAPASTWTANGWAFFDAAVNWAAGAKKILTVKNG